MSIQNPYDHALKILARTYPAEFLRLSFPGQSVRLVEEQANVELALEIDRVDFLHKIELQGTEAYLHIDFQLEHDGDCPRRFFVYNAMLSELKKPTPIITLPVYIRSRVSDPPSRYEVKIDKTVFHTFTYQSLHLWRYVDQIRRGELYIFAPLLPVLTQPMDEALLREERQLILTHEKDPDRQRTLLTTAILIAAQSKLFSSDFLWALFKEDQMDLDNPVIAKLFDRAYGEKLAAETQKLAAEAQKAEQRWQEEWAVAAAQAEAARREAEAARREAEAARREAKAETEAARREAEAARREAEIETEAARREAESEAARQWQELMLKILEHRFTSAPLALVRLLQAVKPAQRSHVSDIILDSPDVESCLQAMRQLQTEA
ncbi:MAG: hypothetical protein R3E79_11575 [Caldilineaceae bacterium]